MGSQIKFMKRVLSVVLSVALTSFVYWYSYLRYTDYLSEGVVTAVTNVSTLIWIGSMLLITMLLYLFFELFSPRELDERARHTGQKFLLNRVRNQWRQQKRLRQVMKIAITNGISRALKYARNRENDRALAIAFRDTLEQCGGIFIKFGQVLSTRKELFSPAFIQELGKLQQNVKPLTEEQVKKILELSLPTSVEEVFSYFDMKPIAAASIGQVHKAILKKNGEEVVVKLLRPDVTDLMRDDLNILVEFAEWISSKSSWAQNLRFRELAVGFAAGLREEVNFDIEVRNTIQISNALKDSEYEVKIPKVFTEYSNNRIIVSDFVHGQSIAVGDTFFYHLKIDRLEFARTVLYSFMEQMLVSGIFHADPHPGNIFIDERDGKPILLDFGAVGRLAAPQQEGIKLLLNGIRQNDACILYDGVMLLVEDVDNVEREEVEQVLGQILLKISYIDHVPTEELIYSLFGVVREFGLSFYPSVSLALRSLITLDGTLRIIKPDFDIFVEGKEYSKKYISSILKKSFEEPRATKELIEDELSMIIPTLRKIPGRIDRLVQRVESGKIILHHDIFSDEKNSSFVTQLFSRFVLLLVGITFGIISTALLAIAQFVREAYAVYMNTAAYVGLFLSAILLVRLAIQALRDMKRSNL